MTSWTANNQLRATYPPSIILSASLGLCHLMDMIGDYELAKLVEERRRDKDKAIRLQQTR
jgi:hypothetical protein